MRQLPSGKQQHRVDSFAEPARPDGLIPVTLRVLSPSPLIATRVRLALSYTKGSNTPAFVDVALSSAASPAALFWLYFTAMKGLFESCPEMVITNRRSPAATFGSTKLA